MPTLRIECEICGRRGPVREFTYDALWDVDAYGRVYRVMAMWRCKPLCSDPVIQR